MRQRQVDTLNAVVELRRNLDYSVKRRVHYLLESAIIIHFGYGNTTIFKDMYANVIDVIKNQIEQ